MAVRDRDLLLAVAGVFLFLPLFALNLLVPPMPALVVSEGMTNAEQRLLAETIAQWVLAYGHWYGLAGLFTQFGQLAVLSLYLDRERPATGAALARSIRRLLVFLLASMIVGVPLTLGMWLVVLLIPALFLSGRLMLTGPVIVAERPIGPLQAIARGWRLTRGNGLVLAGMAAIPILGGLVAAPLLSLDRWLRLEGGGNPVAVTLVDAGAAAVAAAALLATTLIQVAAYRRLAR
ncbi:hypothetical protein DVW87_11145 [Sphingomonas aracearum]|uniref:Uncharacterized protein n=2 Tax=Sphingomonas aracearum TaxID=2283317 RepID=A0A369VX59_9SPHN|nr:hypothetical protein DVW87_11145 [Sphingomonas aracearum]